MMHFLLPYMSLSFPYLSIVSTESLRHGVLPYQRLTGRLRQRIGVHYPSCRGESVEFGRNVLVRGNDYRRDGLGQENSS